LKVKLNIVQNKNHKDIKDEDQVLKLSMKVADQG